MALACIDKNLTSQWESFSRSVSSSCPQITNWRSQATRPQQASTAPTGGQAWDQQQPSSPVTWRRTRDRDRAVSCPSASKNCAASTAPPASAACSSLGRSRTPCWAPRAATPTAPGEGRVEPPPPPARYHPQQGPACRGAAARSAPSTPGPPTTTGAHPAPSLSLLCVGKPPPPLLLLPFPQPRWRPPPKPRARTVSAVMRGKGRDL